MKAAEGTNGGAGRIGAKRDGEGRDWTSPGRGGTEGRANVFDSCFVLPFFVTFVCVFTGIELQKKSRCVLSCFAVLSVVSFYSPHSSSFPMGMKGRDEWRGGAGQAAE